jgi:hypothetical protein
MGRALRKQAKLERRLGDELRRPKGMHRTTYERLLNRLDECEERREVALCRRLEALVLRYPVLGDDPLFRP